MQSELEYHEELYSGFAQQHFAKPAVVAFRRHLARRIVRLTQATISSRVLSLGSGIGDTELLPAPHAGYLLGIDVSPRGVAHAQTSAAAQGVKNAEFLVGALEDTELDDCSFDVIVAVFFLHHLASRIGTAANRIHRLLKPGGVFYSLDPSYYRLSGFLGKLLVPSLMKKYQTEDEEQLKPSPTCNAFSRAGFVVRRFNYDFISTPLAGLFPSWRMGYLLSRRMDDILTKLPGLNLLSSNFELLARKPL